MKILLTGATGLVGKPLCRRLAERGHELVVLSRSVEKARTALAVKCEVHAWDADREAPPKEAFQGVHAIVHLAGEPVAGRRWSAEQKRKIIDSRIKSARELLEAARESRQVKVFISASAIGYYGDRGDETLTESSTPGQGFLSDVCREWESVVTEHSTSYQRAVMVRTGIVLSRDGGALEKMWPLFRAGLGGPLGDGKQWMSWIHLDDLVELYLTALENSACKGPVNGVAPAPVTNEEFTRALGSALGHPTVLRAPAFALRAAMGEMASLVLGSQRVLPESASGLGFRFRYPDLKGALAALVNDGPPEGEDELRSEQWVPKPVEPVFEFFSQAKNLEMLTPPWLSFKVLRQSTPELRSGTLIDYELTIHGLPVSWQSRIEDWEPGRGFSDSQIQGPYSKWHHTHTFELFQGGTLLKDQVRFKVPGGILGKNTVGIKVRKDVEAIFEFRRRKIRAALG